MYKSGLSVSKKQNSKAFTIVELLVVIVVIGILAAITIVSYSGISTRAKVASLQSDLTNSSKLLKMFYVDNGSYPATISTDCVVNPTTTTNLCLKPSFGNNFTSRPYVRFNNNSFRLTATNGALSYDITEDSVPTISIYGATLIATDPANWITVGTQIWARQNLNVGTMVSGITEQTNNGGTNIIEKYCYNNLEANCTDYGAFYQWDEAMNYSRTEGARGICPNGSHIPTDNEWKTLEMYLGMSQAQADAIDWRGDNQGANLKVGGASGLNILLSGGRATDGSFANLNIFGGLWTSTESGLDAWDRTVYSAFATSYRNVWSKSGGVSVRCIAD